MAGVYLSHIWENPTFINNDWNQTTDAFFDWEAFQALRDGTATTQSIHGLIGTAEAPGPLNTIYSPSVLVITPWETINDPAGFTTSWRYEACAKELAERLSRLVTGRRNVGRVLGYWKPNFLESTDDFRTLCRVIMEFGSSCL